MSTTDCQCNYCNIRKKVRCSWWTVDCNFGRNCDICIEPMLDECKDIRRLTVGDIELQHSELSDRSLVLQLLELDLKHIRGLIREIKEDIAKAK